MEYWIYLALMAISTYLVRSVPFALMRRKIEIPFLRSFLYYIPYAVLTAMTIPAVIFAADNAIAAGAGLVVAIAFSLWGKSLTTVAAAACAAVYLVDYLMCLV